MIRPLAVVLTIASAFCLNAVSLTATTGTKYAVGTCEPNLPSYSTISIAVQSVPPGATIFVCPGNYPEQVVIKQPLTLQGVRSGGNDAAVVTVPSGGYSQTVTDHSGNTFTYQILVQTPTPPGPVNIVNLGVDGTGGSVSSGYLEAVYYQDASGTLSDVVMRNQVSGTGNGGGFLADSFLSAQTVTVQNSAVHGFDGAGLGARTNVTAPILTANFKGNTIRAGSNTTGIYAGGASGAIQTNSLNNGQNGYGLYLYDSTMNVSGNTLYGGGASAGSQAVVMDGGSNTVKANRIEAGGQIGIQFYNSGGAAESNIVQSNTIVDSSTAVSGCQGPVSGNTVSGNTIIDAITGVTMLTGNTVTPNSYFVVNTEVVPCY